jgi:peptide/nickel transport system substrate-binding protein
VAWNETGYANPEFDQMLDEALATPDPDERSTIMADIEETLRQSGIIIQPYWRSVYRASQPWVMNNPAHQSFEQHFDQVWIES